MAAPQQPDPNQPIVDALDQAISAAFGETFQRLAAGQDESQIRAQFAQKTAAIIPPQGPPQLPPTHDDTAALLYTAAYHLQQTHLAYSLITALTHQKQPAPLTQTGQLHIIAYPSGPLTTQVAAALALADALQQGQRIAALKIDSIDPNPAMHQLGEKIWQKFVALIQTEVSTQNRQFESLYRACNLITYHLHPDLETIRPQPNADTWLTALPAHQTPPHRRNLDRLYHKIRPQLGLLSHPANDPSLPEKTPFSNLTYRHQLHALNPRTPAHRPLPNLLGRCYAERVTRINRTLRLTNNREISRRTDYDILNWPRETTAQTCAAIPQPQTAPQPEPATPPPPKIEPPPPPQPDPQDAPLTIGARVQTPLGPGQIRRINKSRADIKLDNGLSTSIPLTQLEPAPQ